MGFLPVAPRSKKVMLLQECRSAQAAACSTPGSLRVTTFVTVALGLPTAQSRPKVEALSRTN